MTTFYLHQESELNIGTKKMTNFYSECQRLSLLSRLSIYNGKYLIKTIIKNIESDGEFLQFTYDNVIICESKDLILKIDDIINKLDNYFLIYNFNSFPLNYTIEDILKEVEIINKKLIEFSDKYNVDIDMYRDDDLIYIKFIK